MMVIPDNLLSTILMTMIKYIMDKVQD